MEERYEGDSAAKSRRSEVTLCGECECALRNNRVPKHSLANDLYRGQLPEGLRDITWVEEMVCCIYRTNAYVTRLYQTSDDQDPLVLHGNTCAHHTNIVSTARVLPRTPADVNGLMSVVFVGPGKLKTSSLRNMFYVRKEKIWNLLTWLKQHNPMYKDIVLDRDVLDLFPEDGSLPGIDGRIIYNR
ncbi:hypothetical protein DENSPDRAFT_775768, partial [Dentipellis sp. KUC8613]